MSTFQYFCQRKRCTSAIRKAKSTYYSGKLKFSTAQVFPLIPPLPTADGHSISHHKEICVVLINILAEAVVQPHLKTTFLSLYDHAYQNITILSK